MISRRYKQGKRTRQKSKESDKIGLASVLSTNEPNIEGNSLCDRLLTCSYSNVMLVSALA